MKTLLNLFILVFGLNSFIYAQTEPDIWQEMEQYIQEHFNDPIPDEEVILENLFSDYMRENKVDNKLTATLKAKFEKDFKFSYWKDQFRNFAKYSTEELSELYIAKNGGSPVPNPDLIVGCPISIVVLVDQSGSMSNTERMLVQEGLEGFVEDQLGSGNSLTFMGIVNAGMATPVGPILYDQGEDGTIHLDWINNTLFSTNVDGDTWSTGLIPALGLHSDLVVIISDGADGDNTNNVVCNAANNLKNDTNINANNGTGTHLFVIGQNSTSYEIPGTNNLTNLIGFLGSQITPFPLINIDNNNGDITTSDFASFPTNDFSNIDHILGNLDATFISIETTGLWPRHCIINNLSATGSYDLCPEFSVVNIGLQFRLNNNVLFTLPANFSNGSWSLDVSRNDLIANGLLAGQDYDVTPVITFSNGSVFAGEDFETGIDNDIHIAGNTNPSIALNDSPTNGYFNKVAFCVGDPIFYHGYDVLGNNHHSQIRRRLAGQTGPFEPSNAGYAWMGEGWLGTPLGGYKGNLNEQYPDFFQVGYEYELTIASMNAPECLAWTTTIKVFEIFDCCNFDYELLDYPECASLDEEFVVSVYLDAPLDLDNIALIYSDDNNYTYVSHELEDQGTGVIVNIVFAKNFCTCEGEILTFDIRLDCGTLIWIMTDPIPCCAEPCDVEWIDWGHGDCFMYNGNLARTFDFEFKSAEEYLNVFENVEFNSTGCPVSLEMLNINSTQISSSVFEYTITGIMVFEDQNCVNTGDVALLLESENGCCSIERYYSFNRGCRMSEVCYLDSEVELIYPSSIQSTMTISLDLPPGTVVNVVDNLNGWSYGFSIETILCGPFYASQGGGIGGGTPCNGITIPLPPNVDCTGEVNSNTNYDVTLTYGECTWRLVGDYCHEPWLTRGSDRSLGTNSGSKGDLDFEGGNQRKEFGINDFITISPNPVQQTQEITLDFSNTTSQVTNFEVRTLTGSLVDRVENIESQSSFSYSSEKLTAEGIYFIQFQQADGNVITQKFIVTK